MEICLDGHSEDSGLVHICVFYICMHVIHNHYRYISIFAHNHKKIGIDTSRLKAKDETVISYMLLTTSFFPL